MSGARPRRSRTEVCLDRLRRLTDLLNYLIPQQPRLDLFVVKTWSLKERERLERWCEVQVETLLIPQTNPVPKKRGVRVTLTSRMLTIRALNELPADRIFLQRRA